MNKYKDNSHDEHKYIITQAVNKIKIRKRRTVFAKFTFKFSRQSTDVQCTRIEIKIHVF